jgi:5-methylcytosine-specific restriction protein A
MGRLYDTAAWKRLRKRVLRERGGLCEDCLALGRIVLGTDLDHRVALKDGGEPLDPANIALRCHPCHSSKTAHQDAGFGNKRKARTPIKGCDVHGMPLDPAHAWNKERAR